MKLYRILDENLPAQTAECRLQRCDSRIAEKLVDQALTDRIPILPIHDSFVVAEKDEQWLVDNMKKYSEEVISEKWGVQLAIPTEKKQESEADKADYLRVTLKEPKVA